MFGRRSNGIDVLIRRPRQSAWQRFLEAPVVFLAQTLYHWGLSKAAATRPQPCASDNKVSIVCISDTHNSQPRLPDGDVLIHAGDLTQIGSFEEIQATLDWLQSQPHRHKIVIAGNHDLLLDSNCDGSPGQPAVVATAARAHLNWGDIKYLQESSTTIVCANGRQLKVYGSPRVPRCGNWAFQYERAEDVWTNTVPDDTDILVTHAPPRTHLDLLHLGCGFLLGELWRVRPRLHVFGHIHAGRGEEQLYFDTLQQAYEKAIVSRGGIWNFALVVKGFLESLLGLVTVELEAEAKTLLVNAAVVGGLRNDERRAPIQVDI
ncbi:Metallo-dependent phosphatase-like protein [Lasiosphaeria hispida]|uniref:Metallo-dependent phosphatase-like protein n=1 Tax=Lasiosphaeria hispida TaxID=260671 RepID=A0AAJ0HFS0_9PEZI|nr:Metallo-dependent phosphatase-like protein [Lasiosphaeria hispida]